MRLSRFARSAATTILAASLTAPAAAQDSPDTSQTEAEARPGSAAVSRRPDERRPEAGTAITLFGLPMTITGEYEVSHESRINVDLERDDARDRGRLNQELEIEAAFSPAAGITAFFQLQGSSEFETQRENGPNENFGELQRGQMWLYFERPAQLPLDFQIGRVSLVEARSWWWDDDLDAARIFVERKHWSLETGIAQRVMPVSTAERGIDPEAKDLARWFGRASWAWRKRHTLEAYWLAARDHSGRPPKGSLLHEKREDELDAHLNWFGLRAIGEERLAGGHRLGYWVDAARVSGSEKETDFDGAEGNLIEVDDTERRRISGVGWDLGARWSFPGKRRPTLWAGWAVGSGDADPDDDTDHSFRQTGLEENKGRFGGVKRFRYYGELMRPSLSNLSIRSLGASIRFMKKSSLDLVFHDYRQRHASRELSGGRLSEDPRGERRALGQGVDLFLAVRDSATTEFIAALSTFRAGSAFGRRSGERAWLAELGMTVNF